MAIEEKLSLVRYNVDIEPHIRINTTICKTCLERECLFVCPAECYTLQEDEVTFAHEGCLECGTCYVTCDKKAIDWNLPKGGYGVCFRFV